MKKLKQTICIAVAVMMAVSMLLAGCTGKQPSAQESTSKADTVASSAVSSEASTSVEAPKVDTSKEAKLTMYLLGDKPNDFDEVYGEINKKLKADINASLTVNYLSWSDYSTRYSLIFASGEDFDLIYTANWCYYFEQAVKNGFLEITEEMLQKYAPQTLADVWDGAWDQVRVDEKIYMVPCTKREFANRVYVVRGDLMKKYNIPPIKSLDDLGVYLDAIAKNEPEMIPYDDGSDFNVNMSTDIELYQKNGWSTIYSDFPIVYNITEPENVKLFDAISTPEYLDFLKKMKEWKEKGYWSKNALVNKTNCKDSFLNGKSAAFLHNLNTANSVYLQAMKTHPEWQVEVIDSMNGLPTMAASQASNGVAIHATSKNPERSLMLLDLFRNDRDYFDLTTYGIKGKHWDPVGDNRYKSLSASEGYSPDANCPWGWRTKLYRIADGGAPNYETIFETWDKSAVDHPMSMFVFDDSNVKNEAASCTNVRKTYVNALSLGVVKDVEASIKEYQEKMKTAGYDKIIEELQKQYDEYISKK